jgi:hypothetical protein
MGLVSAMEQEELYVRVECLHEMAATWADQSIQIKHYIMEDEAWVTCPDTCVCNLPPLTIQGPGQVCGYLSPRKCGARLYLLA